MNIRAALIFVLLLAPTFSHADLLKCKIDDYSENIFITTPPDTNSNDGQYARIGVSPGLGNRAMVVADRSGATVFVELNVDGTPIGLISVQKDMQVIKTLHTILNGEVFAPTRNKGLCTRCVSVVACLK